jgi:serine phosphatase RsbU (regulator of sigma subunit)
MRAVRLAELRARLIHADSVAEATEAVTAFLVANIGTTALLPRYGMPEEATRRVRRVTLDEAPAAVRTWMLATGSRDAMSFPIDGAPPSLALVDAKDGGDDALVREVAVDVNRAIALIKARQNETHLTKTLREKDALLRQTTDALFRDAGEVVRVLGELERRDAAMKAELHRALRFQRAMIAPLPSHERLMLDAVYLAADFVSADFYDVAILGPDHVRVFVADATGHGIAAGLATMFVKAEYEAQKRVCATPSELVASMNDTLTSRYETLDLRCTAVCIDVHPARGTMLFTSAAHPGPAVARSNSVELLPGGNTFMGLQAAVRFSTVETTIEPGDLVIAFTDGLLDARSANGASFGRQNLERLARDARAEPALFGSLLVSDLSSFVGEGKTLLDDVTAVALSLRTSRP